MLNFFLGLYVFGGLQMTFGCAVFLLRSPENIPHVAMLVVGAVVGLVRGLKQSDVEPLE